MDLSLFDINSELHELVDQWQGAESPERLSESEALIREYVGREIQRVDGIRRYIRFCDSAETEAREEAQRQAERARMWAARRDRLKAFVLEFMQQWGWKEGKPRKFESPTGSISLRGNGGLQLLVITDATLIPDELCTVAITFRADSAIVKQAVSEGAPVGERTPHNALIREALARGAVAGCRLDERGESIVVR